VGGIFPIVATTSAPMMHVGAYIQLEKSVITVITIIGSYVAVLTGDDSDCLESAKDTKCSQRR